ncbi:MAG: hypothetical protein ACHRXM_38505 [Isosphaerales bacterium]
MNQQQAKWVVPNPQIPRTFGLMNIIFGSLMLLIGGGYAMMYAVSPMFARQMQVAMKKQQEVQKATRESKLAELKRQEEAAKTKDEKATLREERVAFEKNVEPDLPDLSDLMGWNAFSDVRLAIYYCSEVGAGMLLNLLMIISGAGLMALAEWARRLALGVAWLKILRWVAMVVVMMVLVLPITVERTQKVFQQMETQGKAQSGGRVVVFPLGQMGRFTAIAGAVTVVFSAVVASVYPALSLWFLTRGPTRAACLKELPATELPNAKEAGEAW